MRSTLFALMVSVLGITTTLSASLEQIHGIHRPKITEEQINYLRSFGHWHGPKSDQIGSNVDDLSRYPMACRNCYGLKAAEEFDEKTKGLMSLPWFDALDHKEASGRRKRYAFIISRWPVTDLTYRIENYTPDLPTNVTRRILIRALKYWSDVTRLTFTETNVREEANITFVFIATDYVEGYPFDGPGNVLGKGLPYPWGLVAFDEEEKWSYGVTSGTDDVDLLWIATRQMGHALGLDNSDVPSAVMFPEYPEDNRTLDFTLDPDDIEGIQILYGKPSSTIPPKSTVRPPTPTTHRIKSLPPTPTTHRSLPPTPTTQRTTSPIRIIRRKYHSNQKLP